jgi:hypothetical protein
VQLYLLWYTEGKGDEDTAIVEQLELAAGELRGDVRFSVKLPEGPYSFEGRYISLQWALELVTKDPFNVVRENIMVSPWVKKVTSEQGCDDASIDLSSDFDAPVTAAANPFGSRYIDAIPFRFDGAGLDDLLARLTELRGRGAIIGPHGSGKTTLMEQLGARLQTDGWHVVPVRTQPGQSALDQLSNQSLTGESAVLLDGAGHIGVVQWRRVLLRVRGAGRLIVTAHTPGRLPTLFRCEPSIALLDALVADLAPVLAGELRPVAHALYARHNGNMRDVLRGLYDHCAGL